MRAGRSLHSTTNFTISNHPKKQKGAIKMKQTVLVLLVLLFGVACSLKEAIAPVSQNAEPFPIIDVHMHTYQ